VLLIAAAGLVAIALLRISPALWPAASLLWPLVVIFNVAAALQARRRYGHEIPRRIYGGFLAAVLVSFVILTGVAPNRSPGCEAQTPRPVWDVFCVAPDSASYYFGYTTGSVRQPLYPWFIDLMTAGTGFNPAEYVKHATPAAPRDTPGDPLFRVVRAQIVLLLAAALVSCAALMWMLRSPLPALAFVAMYDRQFFSAVELNVVLTEPLVQTFLCLVLAAFAAFFVRMRPAFLIAASASSSLAYLTRQASAYTVLLVAVLALMALVDDWRRWWRWVGASAAVWVVIAAVPDAYGLIKTGDLSSQQVHLQYQYRIAHALQYARPADLALMPDDESRRWLADAMVRRDQRHQAVDLQYQDEFSRMVFYIAANLYEVATPIEGFPGEIKSPEFYMKVATPILREHWMDYASFAFRFWKYGLTDPGMTRLDAINVSMWYIYAAIWAAILWLRNRPALAAGALVLAHWSAIGIISLAAVPIPRMINASELLVVVAALIAFWSLSVRLLGATRKSPELAHFVGDMR
jgi:hypothetical protein